MIIGAGPGGYETALSAARSGIETILIESGDVGGTCLNAGCIPTKSLCRSARLADEFSSAERFGFDNVGYSLDFRKVMERKRAVVEQLRGNVETLLCNPLIHLIRGEASFSGSRSVTVDGEEYSADDIIIATGSLPASLPIEGCDLPGVITSTELLDSEELPKRLCIIGAGVIGLEFASIFRSFGCDVTVLEYAKEVLPRCDSDMAKRLRQSLGKRGIEIVVQAEVKRIELSDGGELTVAYERKGKEAAAVADKVLMAVGRKPNLEKLNLDKAGVEYGKRGITVDDDMRTSTEHIYAIGDVNGLTMLAHAATYQGIRALNAISGVADETDLNVVPSAVFTVPECASVGFTEDECKEQGMEYKCLKSFYRANGKAVCLGETDGYCKLIVGAGGRLLGCHIIGEHSADIIQEITGLIAAKADLNRLKSVIHPHPALCEVVQSAAHSL